MIGVLLCFFGRHDWNRECFYAQRELCDTPNAWMVDRCARCRATREVE